MCFHYGFFSFCAALLEVLRSTCDLRWTNSYYLYVFHVARYACNALRVLQSSVAVTALATRAEDLDCCHVTEDREMS